MKASLFITQVKEWWSTITGKITTTINEKKEAETYLYEQVLTEEFSTDGKWDSASVSDSVVAADEVAYESPYPLKSRPSMGKAGGEIGKIAIKKRKGEVLINKINTLLAIKKIKEAIIAIFDDAGKCVLGVKERLEIMFLSGISTGYVEVRKSDDQGNPLGTSIRYKYGYLDENTHKVGKDWSDPTALTISDFARALEAAGGKGAITAVWLRTEALDKMRNSLEAKRLGAQKKLGYYPADEQLAPLMREEFIALMKAEYGVDFKVRDRVVYVEVKGKKKPIKPFDPSVVLLLPQDTDLGRVVYANLAEQTNPVEGVQYAEFGFIQLAQHSTIEGDTPVEVTRAHARALPVIDGCADIHRVIIDDVDADLLPVSEDGGFAVADIIEPLADDAAVADFTCEVANFDATKLALLAIGITVTSSTTNPSTLQAKVVALDPTQWAAFIVAYNGIITA